MGLPVDRGMWVGLPVDRGIWGRATCRQVLLELDYLWTETSDKNQKAFVIAN